MYSILTEAEIETVSAWTHGSACLTDRGEVRRVPAALVAAVDEHLDQRMEDAMCASMQSADRTTWGQW